MSEFKLREEDFEQVAFVTDGASNMSLAFNIPGRVELFRLTCACHMLNTAHRNMFNQKLTSDFLMPKEAQPIAKLISDCKLLVKHCKQASLSRALSIAPVQECETRWNSNVDMLDSIIRLYPELRVLLMERDERKKLPEPLELLKAVADILRPLKDSTVTLSSSSCPTLHLVMTNAIHTQSGVSIAESYSYPRGVQIAESY